MEQSKAGVTNDLPEEKELRASVECTKKLQVKDTDIAVIGISLRYPKSNDIDEFWNNIVDQKQMTDVIPKERWNYQDYYDEDITNEEKANSIYGGFLEGVDQFDAKFFRISPAEAELMDPQQRILLEQAWKAVEDAGYSESEISGKRCGVYMGATHGDYEKILEQSGLKNSKYAFTGLNPFMFTGRIAYLMNLKGPNMCIDTACSSSLVAISTACQSIVDGECEMALAGGIRLMLTPDLQIQTSNIGLLATDGKVRSFDKEADGLVLSEGVGVLLLKPLKMALHDGNHVYGVIKGWGVNQDGKSNGITSPSTQAEIELLQEVYERFDINPENINYVEANGTASELGDTMEINALTKVYETYTDKKQFCYLGTAKANMGHTTMASGVGGVIKVLLSMNHKTIPALNHFKTENSHLHFSNTPFIPNKENVRWEQHENPRMATVSSFGLSGTNAHIVLQEAPMVTRKESKVRDYYLIVLSGKSKATLDRRVTDLQQWLSVHDTDVLLEDIQYTLSAGRSHYKYRLAMIVQDIKELKDTLEFTRSKKISVNILYQQEGKTAEKQEESIQQKLDSWYRLDTLTRGDLLELAKYYVEGKTIDFSQLRWKDDARIVSMPSYPFERTSFWVQKESKKGKNSVVSYEAPLVHRNVSTLMEQRYQSYFNGQEYYFEEHKIYDQKVLPGMFYLEMALEAVSMATKEHILGLSDILWYSPVVVKDKVAEVFTEIHPFKERLDVEIAHDPEDKSTLHFICSADFEKELEELEDFQVESIIERCKENITGEEYYQRFQNDSLYLGKHFHSIQVLHRNENEALSEVKLADCLTDTLENYVIHPILLNSAVETLIVLMNDKDHVYMPLAVKEFFILSETANIKYAYICRKSIVNQMHKFNLYLLDENGDIVVYIKEITIKEAP